MTPSRLFFNSSIIRQNLRQHGWIGIIYALGLLFALPVQMFTRETHSSLPQEIKNLFQIGNGIQSLFIVVFPVAAGLFLLYYLQGKSPSDLWHGLPFRREHLLATHLLSGLLLLLPPVWLTAAVTAVVRQWGGNMFSYEGADIWSWCLMVSLLTIFLFCFSVFVGICTGQSIVQGIITYILLLLPAFLILLMNSHLSVYLYGYPYVYNVNSNAEIWSPLMHIMNIAANPFSVKEVWIYGALSVVFIIMSFLLYRKRHVEKAGQAIAFTAFNPLFKAGVMFCAMLICGTYFTSGKQQLGWVIGGYAIGALIGYVVAEMILRKTWQIFTRRVPLEWAVYTVLISLLLYIPASGLTGYENRVPSNDKISGVFAGGNYWMRDYSQDTLANLPIDQDPFSSDKDYIEAVRKLHLALAAVRPERNSQSVANYTRYQSFTLAYQLNNSRKLVREYLVPVKGFEPELKAVMETEAYKSEAYQMFQLEENTYRIRLSNRDKVVDISNPVEIAEFKEILKREILNMSFEEQTSDRTPQAYIEVYSDQKQNVNRSSLFYEWKPFYQELESWLVEKGYADRVRTTSAEIKSAEIMKDDFDGRISYEELYNPEKHVELARSEKRTAVTADKNFITSILEHERDFAARNGMILVRMEYKNGNTEYVQLEDSDLTPALRALLP
ncbi:DUF6449 domain-containing protein [Paenibacillus monticola]|uniref:Multidrug ABC transporter permease n=1 Tax=Paenibacillus monticola TaxID=2666075 RepID=A0A7X2KZB8_9BACL|nr:DUF6449 domain-containing protein [Paenibacillus monticola]MRN51517.1 hypothetical protein [Paenibacillus monticola]